MTRPSDDARFVDFIEREHGRLSRTAQLLAGNRAGADDLLQEALLRTYVAWGRVEIGRERAYVRRVMVNLVTDRWRRRRFEPVLGDDSDRHPRADSGEGYARIDNRDDIVRQLASLSPRERTVLVLRFLEDLSEADVAAELGIPLGTVKSTCSRALARLRSASEPNPSRSGV